MPPFSAPALRTSESADGNRGEGPRGERLLAFALLAAALALRCFYIFRYRYDSDEPQHLHTTWGWTQGLLQYRDFFDNHTPLFHLLFSPLVAALGERADILDFMRFAIVPLWAVCLWCVWKIGRTLFSPRAGLWAAVFIALLPWWFFPALEYRTDNLWTPLWLGALTVLVTGRMSCWRGFAGGVLLGLCFCASMKTTVLFAASALAALAAPQLVARGFSLREIGRSLRAAGPVVAGALLAPAALCAFFAAQGAWGEFYYGVIGHNILPGVDAKNHPAWLRLIFPLALPFLGCAALRIARWVPERALAERRVFVFLVAGLYYAALYSFWTLLTRQDFLPFYPLVAILAAPLLAWLAETRGRPLWGLACVGVIEIALILGGRPPWIDGTVREREILRDTLRLTRPGEFVMDFKGECVFRQRAFRFVTEPLTFVRLRRGIIADTVAADMLDKKVMVALNQNRWFPKDGTAFMTENFLPIGHLRVAGKVIAKEPVGAGAPVPFQVAVPASYALWAGGQPVTGTLDGTPYTGPRELAAGPHEFRPAENHPRLAIIWQRALDAGFIPGVDEPKWEYFR